MSSEIGDRMVQAVRDWAATFPQGLAPLMTAIGEEYVQAQERADHWIDREREFRIGRMDKVELFAYLAEQLRQLPPGTVGDAAAMAAALILRAAKPDSI